MTFLLKGKDSLDREEADGPIRSTVMLKIIVTIPVETVDRDHHLDNRQLWNTARRRVDRENDSSFGHENVPVIR